MLKRPGHLKAIQSLLNYFPVTAILGPRQVGKTTLALAAAGRGTLAARFDLEDPADLEKLKDPMAALADLRGVVVLDEIQRRPEIFPILRVLADRPKRPASFLVLGSASPALLKQSSESLAGRISYHYLDGFDLKETGTAKMAKLWLRGAFPKAFLAPTEEVSLRWRAEFMTSYLERDIPQLDIKVPAATLRRFWAMLAHYHGQVWNGAEFASSFGVADATIRRYLDILVGTFMVRLLRPWHENLGKRQVKAPKVYLADTGMLHLLQGIRSAEDLELHPKCGPSWESFAMTQVVHQLGVSWDECYFWATHNGAELDLLVVRGRQRLGFEFKKTSAPGLTPSMRNALRDLKLSSLDVIYPGKESYSLSQGVRAVSIHQLEKQLSRLR